MLIKCLGRAGPKNGGEDIPKAVFSSGGGEICFICREMDPEQVEACGITMQGLKDHGSNCRDGAYITSWIRLHFSTFLIS